ncbi:MAG: hypothetical protein EZS28_036968 [Streblomastix strix]|uniref:Uncharacterized protein n=1 Tax=Streblomastix strix TaxID=222440 RepID=A0A5J4U9C4_9EUKA|nr:MAG: hypothetical protein EZS28_036968 [Streblomastix strix]
MGFTALIRMPFYSGAALHETQVGLRLQTEVRKANTVMARLTTTTSSQTRIDATKTQQVFGFEGLGSNVVLQSAGSRIEEEKQKFRQLEAFKQYVRKTQLDLTQIGDGAFSSVSPQVLQIQKLQTQNQYTQQKFQTSSLFGINRGWINNHLNANHQISINYAQTTASLEKELRFFSNMRMPTAEACHSYIQVCVEDVE